MEYFFQSTQHANSFGVCYEMGKKCSKMRSLYIPFL